MFTRVKALIHNNHLPAVDRIAGLQIVALRSPFGQPVADQQIHRAAGFPQQIAEKIPLFTADLVNDLPQGLAACLSGDGATCQAVCHSMPCSSTRMRINSATAMEGACR